MKYVAWCPRGGTPALQAVSVPSERPMEGSSGFLLRLQERVQRLILSAGTLRARELVEVLLVEPGFASSLLLDLGPTELAEAILQLESVRARVNRHDEVWPVIPRACRKARRALKEVDLEEWLDLTVM